MDNGPARVPAMKNFTLSLANARSQLSTFIFFRLEYWRCAALKFFLAALWLLLAGVAGAEDPASWRRWLDSGPSPFVFSRHALSGLPDAAAQGGIDRSDATESLLDWTSYSLTLVQKYQQNPQRAGRSLASNASAILTGVWIGTYRLPPIWRVNPAGSGGCLESRPCRSRHVTRAHRSPPIQRLACGVLSRLEPDDDPQGS